MMGERKKKKKKWNKAAEKAITEWEATFVAYVDVKLTAEECGKLAGLCLGQAMTHANMPEPEPGRQEPWLALAEKLNRAAV